MLFDNILCEPQLNVSATKLPAIDKNNKNNDCLQLCNSVNEKFIYIL